jgi:hypothetical protein
MGEDSRDFAKTQVYSLQLLIFDYNWLYNKCLSAFAFKKIIIYSSVYIDVYKLTRTLLLW